MTYSDIESYDTYEKIAGFKTFEHCQAAALNRIRQLPKPDRAGYECGYMCRYEPDWQVDVCKETQA